MAPAKKATLASRKTGSVTTSRAAQANVPKDATQTIAIFAELSKKQRDVATLILKNYNGNKYLAGREQCDAFPAPSYAFVQAYRAYFDGRLARTPAAAAAAAAALATVSSTAPSNQRGICRGIQGMALFAAGDYASAHAAYADAVKLDPYETGNYREATNAAIMCNDLGAAMKYLERYGSLNQSTRGADVVDGMIRTILMAQSGKTKQALDVLNNKDNDLYRYYDLSRFENSSMLTFVAHARVDIARRAGPDAAVQELAAHGAALDPRTRALTRGKLWRALPEPERVAAVDEWRQAEPYDSDAIVAQAEARGVSVADFCDTEYTKTNDSTRHALSRTVLISLALGEVATSATETPAMLTWCTRAASHFTARRTAGACTIIMDALAQARCAPGRATVVSTLAHAFDAEAQAQALACGASNVHDAITAAKSFVNIEAQLSPMCEGSLYTGTRAEWHAAVFPGPAAAPRPAAAAAAAATAVLGAAALRAQLGTQPDHTVILALPVLASACSPDAPAPTSAPGFIQPLSTEQLSLIDPVTASLTSACGQLLCDAALSVAGARVRALGAALALTAYLLDLDDRALHTVYVRALAAAGRLGAAERAYDRFTVISDGFVYGMDNQNGHLFAHLAQCAVDYVVAGVEVCRAAKCDTDLIYSETMLAQLTKDESEAEDVAADVAAAAADAELLATNDAVLLSRMLLQAVSYLHGVAVITAAAVSETADFPFFAAMRVRPHVIAELFALRTRLRSHQRAAAAAAAAYRLALASSSSAAPAAAEGELPWLLRRRGVQRRVYTHLSKGSEFCKGDDSWIYVGNDIGATDLTKITPTLVAEKMLKEKLLLDRPAERDGLAAALATAAGKPAQALTAIKALAGVAAKAGRWQEVAKHILMTEVARIRAQKLENWTTDAGALLTFIDNLNLEDAGVPVEALMLPC